MLRRFPSLIFWLALISPIGIGTVWAVHHWERGLPGIIHFIMIMIVAVPAIGVSVLIALLWPYRHKPSSGERAPAPWDAPDEPKPQERGFEVIARQRDVIDSPADL